MPINTIGPWGASKGNGVATLSLSPVTDRAAVIRRVLITNPSASDTWVVSCDGQELARFLERTTGFQQLLGSKTASYPKTYDIFQYLRAIEYDDLIYPVPLGTTWTIASVGGATANILVEYTEHAPGELSTGMINHPHGTRKLLPVYAYKAASVTAAGDQVFDTEVKPSFVPTLFTDSKFPPAWNARIVALFQNALGVNAYASSTDHLSNTDHLYIESGGQRLFNRTANDGIPTVGTPAAAGSANTSYESTLSSIPPFQEVTPWELKQYNPLLAYNPGSTYLFRLNVAGDVGAGADYSGAVLCAIVDVLQTGAAA